MSWSINNIDSHQLALWLSEQSKSVCVVDVREMKEMGAGIINGALSMPLATLPARMNELREVDKLVFVCRSGARSASACGFLQQQGYKNVYNLHGGMLSWSASNLPMKRL